MPRKKADETPEATPAVTVSKADAVRAAMTEGIKKPDDAVVFIKDRFGIEISKQMYSSYKSAEKARHKKKGSPAVGKRKATVPSLSGRGSDGSPAELARQVKALVQEYGAVAVSDMLAVFTD